MLKVKADLARDVEDFHLEKQTHLKFDSVGILSAGPLRATLFAEARHGQSTVAIKVSCALCFPVTKKSDRSLSTPSEVRSFFPFDYADKVAASLQTDSRSMIRFDAVVYVCVHNFRCN